MKQFRIFPIIFFTLLSIGCSSGVSSDNNVLKDSDNTSMISIEDQNIIKAYKDKINSLDFSDRELVNKTMRDSLPQINKIEDDYEREKIQMNIYFALEMYKEAYDLNEKQIKNNPNPQNLIIKCELIHTLKYSRKEYEACHTELASVFKKELEVTPKNSPEYIYGEWGYLLSMYKSGHNEYQIKLKKMLDSIKDEQIKFQLKGSYALAVEQMKSYK